MPKFGISNYSLGQAIRTKQLDAAGALAWLCEAGCDVIEMTAGMWGETQSEAALALIREEARRLHAPLANYSTGGQFVPVEEPLFEQEFDKIAAQMRLAHSLGIRTMRVDVVRWDMPAERRRAENFLQDLPAIIGAYQALCDRAAPYGITVLIENHGLNMNGADRIRMVVKGVDRANFGAQVDVGNFLCVDDDPVVAMQKTVDLAKTVHFKDFYVRPADQYPGAAAGYDDAWFQSANGTYLRGAVTGHGDVDVRRVMRVLKQAGFEGNIYLEFEGVEECRWASATGLANMRRLWDEA